MTSFQRPKRLACDRDALGPRFGHFYAQPFERGFGTTLGNALRRILLSSIEGAAVTAVKIEGVPHEFSSITGVHEDVTDIIMNLKLIPVKLHTDRPKTVYLESNGAGPVKAGDIKPDPDVEILDPDIEIANVNETGGIKMEMRIRKARGYQPADENFEEEMGLGYILMDSVHSPVTKVNFFVEAARLGHATDYDRLNLDVWTDGSIGPEDAIAQAAKILKDQLFIFINFEEESEPISEDDEQHLEAINDNLSKSVEELELSVRSYNCLKNANIQTIGQLVMKTEADMLKTKNFGRKSLNEIKEILAGMGLSFGINVNEQGQPVAKSEGA